MTNDQSIILCKMASEGHFTKRKSIGHADAFINLAGVSINDGRWTAKHQKQIYESRMTATDELLTNHYSAS